MKRLKNYSLFLMLLIASCSSIKNIVFKDLKQASSKELSSDFKQDRSLLAKFDDQKVTSKPEKNNIKTRLRKKKRNTSDVNRVPASAPIMTDVWKEEGDESDLWSSSKPVVIPGEEFVFSVSYFGITAGYISLKTQSDKEINDVNCFHFKASLKSARFYSSLYSLNDTIDSYVSRDKFLPIKYVLTQRESGQSVDDLQLFDHKEQKTHVFYKRLKKGKKKTYRKVASIPDSFQDSYSAIHFVRSLPLNLGDRYEFPVLTRGKRWILKAHVAKKEKIEVMDKELMAYKINAQTHYPGVLEKKGDIHFWFSANEEKRLLKFDAKVKIGSIKGDLVEYRKPKS